MGETAEKYKLLKKLNFMIMKLNTIQNAAAVFEMPQRYLEKMAERFEPGDGTSSGADAAEKNGKGGE